MKTDVTFKTEVGGFIVHTQPKVFFFFFFLFLSEEVKRKTFKKVTKTYTWQNLHMHIMHSHGSVLFNHLIPVSYSDFDW